MKKLTRKLLLSIIAVLFAFATLGTSTFAWFSTNTKVTASSMSVTAASPEPYLQIKLAGAQDDTYVNDLVNNVSATELKLITVSAISGATVTWGFAHSSNPNAVQETNSLTAIASVAADSTETSAFIGSYGDTPTAYGKIYLKQSYTLKNTSTVDASNLIVHAKVANVTGAGTSDGALDSALRVLVVTSSGYALFSGEGVELAAVQNKGYATGDTPTYVLAASNAQLAATLAANATLDVDVYVYFDGTDTNAKNATTISTNALQVDLMFTINGDTTVFQ